MGCGPSAAQQNQRRRVQNNKQNASSPRAAHSQKPKQQNQETKIPNNVLFEQLTSGCKKIASPGNMMPTVCLTRDAFPIATSHLHLDDSTPTDIQLPIITCSQAKGARIVCFSQLSYLQSIFLRTCDTQRIVSNCLNWAAGGVASMTKIALLGFNKQLAATTLKTLHEYGFFAEMFTGKIQLSNYHAVICQSDFNMNDTDLVENLTNFIDNGGGLVVFHKHCDSMEIPLPINALLTKYGLAYTYCILNEKLDECQPITVPPQFSMVRDNNFVLLTARFKAIIGQSSIDTSALDDIVTLLRYYIMVTDNSLLDSLKEIYEYSWDYLRKSNYSTEAGMCPDIKHGIIVVLIQELIPKLPVSIYTSIPEHTIFPGKTGDVELKEYTMTLDLQQDIWVATGLWLPAGVIGEVEIHGDNLINGLTIQVGSHYTSLLAKQGALKRWPSVVSFFTADKLKFEVGTSFGGIVYVTCIEPIDQIQVTITFRNFCNYPRYIIGQPEIWEATKDISVPWGEVETANCVFTLPTDEIKKIEDFDELNDKFTIIAEGISEFMNFSHGFPYRIVFDVEASDESANGGYPLVFLIDDIPNILRSWDKPNRSLFMALSVMSVMSLREDCFDQTTEIALAAVSTANVMEKLYPDFDPLSFEEVEKPKLFAELWEIHTKVGRHIIPGTLGRFQEPEFQLPEIPDDMWVCFVKELCTVGERDFTSILDRARPIPLNISISLHGLPKYQPEE